MNYGGFHILRYISFLDKTHVSVLRNILAVVNAGSTADHTLLIRVLFEFVLCTTVTPIHFQERSTTEYIVTALLAMMLYTFPR